MDNFGSRDINCDINFEDYNLTLQYEFAENEHQLKMTYSGKNLCYNPECNVITLSKDITCSICDIKSCHEHIKFCSICKFASCKNCIQKEFKKKRVIYGETIESIFATHCLVCEIFLSNNIPDFSYNAKFMHIAFCYVCQRIKNEDMKGFILVKRISDREGKEKHYCKDCYKYLNKTINMQEKLISFVEHRRNIFLTEETIKAASCHILRYSKLTKPIYTKMYANKFYKDIAVLIMSYFNYMR